MRRHLLAAGAFLCLTLPAAAVPPISFSQNPGNVPTLAIAGCTLGGNVFCATGSGAFTGSIQATSLQPTSTLVPGNGLYLPGANNPAMAAANTEIMDFTAASRFAVHVWPKSGESGQLYSYVDNSSAGWCSGAASLTDCINIDSGVHRFSIYTNAAAQFLVSSAGVVTLNTANYASCTALTTNALAAIGCTTSDRRLKNDQGVIAGPVALAAVLAIAPHGFTYKDPQLLGSDGRQHFGFFAQDVRRRFPQLVSTGPATHLTPGGTLHLDKGELLAVAWAAIRQQQHEIASLKASIRSLESGRRSHP